ncbi:MAG: hypothetical protein ACI8TA_000297, partial [Cyclobacteriaceae bacterium]
MERMIKNKGISFLHQLARLLEKGKLKHIQTSR